MKALVSNICGIMHNISLAFEGNLGKDNPEMVSIRKDVLHGRIPSIADDKENLRNDGRNIAGDFRKAFDEYVEVHS